MGFVPGYEHDIFISYSHVDNDPLIEGRPGWVDFFEDVLRKRVRVRLGGEELAIFRDPQLRTYGKFSDQLAASISSSAVFLCILSPRYADSEWCLHELGEFSRQVGTDRILKVVKTAVDHESARDDAKARLEQIKDVLDIRFYEKIERTGMFKDLQPEVIPTDIPAFLDKIDGLTQNLVELLKKLRNFEPRPVQVQTARPIATDATAVAEVGDPNQITVYLAETTKDLVQDRNRVKTELQQFNCRVLPDQPLPSDADALVTAVRNNLQQAKLSVHLVGATYGTVLESETRSIPHVQYDVAGEVSATGSLSRLVWMPDGLTSTQPQQQKFIDDVKNSSTEFLRTKLEDLKTEIHKKLTPELANGWEDDDGGDPINVCLFCHDQDMKSAGPLYSYMMFEKMFRVKLPLKDAQSIQRQKDLLQASDAVLLYYGSADEDWFVNIWRLIQRHISARKTKPVLAFYAGNPPTAEKEMLQSDELLIIKNYGQFTSNCLNTFVEMISAAKGGAA